MDAPISWSPTEEAKAAYWEALYHYIRYAQDQELSILALPLTEEGMQLLGVYYTRAADLFEPVLHQAAASNDGIDAINTLLTFALITSAHLQEMAHNPGSTAPLFTVVMRHKPPTLTDELWGEMERILELWQQGFFHPKNYPATYEQTCVPDEGR